MVGMIKGELTFSKVQENNLELVNNVMFVISNQRCTHNVNFVKSKM